MSTVRVVPAPDVGSDNHPSVVFFDAAMDYAKIRVRDLLPACTDVDAAIRAASRVDPPTPPDVADEKEATNESDSSQSEICPEIAVGSLHQTILEAIAGSPSIEKLRGSIGVQVLAERVHAITQRTPLHSCCRASSF